MLALDISDFAPAAADAARMEARQRVAVALLCGIDLSVAFKATGRERRHLAGRIRRLIERERLRGITRHWAYDLNRHIALKQVLDRLIAQDPSPGRN